MGVSNKENAMAEAEKKESKKEDAKPVATKEDIEKNKVMGVLAYIGLLVLVPLLAAKDSPFAQFHANQGIILLIFGFIVGVAAGVPIIGWFLIAPFGSIFVFVLAIMGIINAAQGEMKELPLIGGFKILN